MAQEKTNVMRILDKMKIDYQTFFYDADDGKIDGVSVAQKIGMPEEIVFKTLVTMGGKNHYVFVVPVAKELNLKECAKSVGEKSIEMIKPADLMKVTGYIRGGCSPIGMKKQLKTVIDVTAQNLNEIILSGGKIGCQVKISPENLAKAIPFEFAQITAN